MTSPVVTREERLTEYREELRGLACSLSEPHTDRYREFVHERAEIILLDCEDAHPDTRDLAAGLVQLTTP